MCCSPHRPPPCRLGDPIDALTLADENQVVSIPGDRPRSGNGIIAHLGKRLPAPVVLLAGRPWSRPTSRPPAAGRLPTGWRRSPARRIRQAPDALGSAGRSSGAGGIERNREQLGLAAVEPFGQDDRGARAACDQQTLGVEPAAPGKAVKASRSRAAAAGWPAFPGRAHRCDRWPGPAAGRCCCRCRPRNRWP